MTFTTTLFALIRDNLKINVRESAEMDQVLYTVTLYPLLYQLFYFIALYCTVLQCSVLYCNVLYRIFCFLIRTCAVFLNLQLPFCMYFSFMFL